jgi:hypothetical protein
MGIIGGVKMEGAFFYWFLWMGWIITTFLVRKNDPNRFRLSAFFLLAIVFSEINVPFLGFTLNGTFIFLYVMGFVYLANTFNEKWMYLWITSLIVTLSYNGYLFLQLVDPVWMIFHPQWMLAAFIFALTMIVYSDCTKSRMLSGLLGMMQGEVMFQLLLAKWGFSSQIGTHYVLDMICMFSFLHLVWKGLENLSYIIDTAWLRKERGKEG